MSIILPLKKCCDSIPSYKITYSCGPEPDQTLLVCEKHYNEEPFQRCIKKIDELKNG